MDDYKTYIHNIDPFLIQFTENFGVRWYGLAYLAGFVVGYFFLQQMIRRSQNMDMRAEWVIDFITWSAFGVLIGGRLGYCIFYAPELFLKFSGSIPFWGVLEVYKGGMASHGGMIGVAVACYLFARKYKINFLHCLDAVAICGAPLGFFFGRLANFVNGELYGRVVESKIPWAVKFPGELREWAGYNPEKLNRLSPFVESLGSFSLGEGKRTLEVSQEQWVEWVSQYTLNVSANRNVNQVIQYIQDQIYKGHAQVIEGMQWVLSPRHPSQIYQALLEGFLVFICLNLIWLKPRKPGVIAMSFAFLYGLARIIGEQFRMPDPGLGFELLGLTRGQWLSVALIAVALLGYFYAIRQDVSLMGGWNLSKNTDQRTEEKTVKT